MEVILKKTNQAYFIRGEGLVGSLEDIEQIVVDERNGSPLLIRDVAEVGFGHATRFGAITGNGQGEKVLGQVMMLKDANSKAVIDAVHKRVEEVQKTLPEGIKINAFLDRSELIEKTTTYHCRKPYFRLSYCGICGGAASRQLQVRARCGICYTSLLTLCAIIDVHIWC